VLKRRKTLPWIVLVLSLLIPFGHAVTGNLFRVPINVNPATGQAPVAPEEEETHSHSKVAVARPAKGKRGRLLISRGWSVLPSLARNSEAELPRSWAHVSIFRLPSTLHLRTSLSHRGPPSA